MVDIVDKASWWAVAEEYWDDLLAIIAHHMQLDHPSYERPGQSDSPMTGRTILEDVIHCKKTRDNHRLARYLNGAWCLASDAYAWSVPGWGVLCDLCSEEWVFHEEEV